MLRTDEQDTEIKSTHEQVTISNEPVTSHMFLRKEKSFEPSHPATMDNNVRGQIPQALEMVNQTVSIPS